MFIFHFKKIFKSFENICLLFCIVIIPLFCFNVGKSISIPKVAYVVSDEALKISEVDWVIDELKKENYVRYESKESMLIDIDNSIIDAGIVIKDDFLERIKKNDVDGIIEFISSESSFFSDMRKLEVLSKFMTVYAPYVTYDTIKRIAKGMYEEEYNIEKIKTAYYNMYNEGDSVNVNVEKIDGGKLIVENKGEIYFRIALVILSIIYIIFFVLMESINFSKQMSSRLTTPIIIKKIFIPSIIIRALTLCLFIFIAIYIKL